MAADLAVIGTGSRTTDPQRPFATAAAINSGTIIAVGDDAAIRAECDGPTEIVNGAGMQIVPGLTDSHFRPFWGTDSTQGAHLINARTLDDLSATLSAERKRVAPNAWIFGWGPTFEMVSGTSIRGDLVAGDPNL